MIKKCFWSFLPLCRGSCWTQKTTSILGRSGTAIAPPYWPLSRSMATPPSIWASWETSKPSCLFYICHTSNARKRHLLRSPPGASATTTAVMFHWTNHNYPPPQAIRSIFHTKISFHFNLSSCEHRLRAVNLQFTVWCFMLTVNASSEQIIWPAVCSVVLAVSC